MPLSPRINKLVFLLFILAALGFADAAYLTAEHYAGKIPPCSLTGGCETVLTSRYATVFGVPVALFGALFYFAAFLMLFFYRETGERRYIFMLAGASGGAFLASFWFAYLQFFVLKALCLYCLISAGTSTLIFAISAWIALRRERMA